jgi:peroxiredoxin
MRPGDQAPDLSLRGSEGHTDRLKDLADRTAGCASRRRFDIGADGRIQDIDKKVSAASHGGDIVARLADLTS